MGEGRQSQYTTERRHLNSMQVVQEQCVHPSPVQRPLSRSSEGRRRGRVKGGVKGKVEVKRVERKTGAETLTSRIRVSLFLRLMHNQPTVTSQGALIPFPGHH